jgi:hypothetical protein
MSLLNPSERREKLFCSGGSQRPWIAPSENKLNGCFYTYALGYLPVSGRQAVLPRPKGPWCRPGSHLPSSTGQLAAPRRPIGGFYNFLPPLRVISICPGQNTKMEAKRRFLVLKHSNVTVCVKSGKIELSEISRLMGGQLTSLIS